MPITEWLSPKLPHSIEGRVGSLQLSIQGSALVAEWPWTGEGCRGPSGEGETLIIRASFQPVGEPPATSVFWDGVWVFLNANKWYWFQLAHGWSTSGSLKQGVGEGERWLVFQFPEGFVIAESIHGDPHEYISEDWLTGISEGKWDEEQMGPQELWVRHIEWLVETYPDGTPLWENTSLSLVVLDPYTGIWGSFWIPDVDPFADVDLEGVCSRLVPVGTPGISVK